MSDSLSDLVTGLQAILDDHARVIVAELIGKGWQPPPGWTDADTDRLGHGTPNGAS